MKEKILTFVWSASLGIIGISAFVTGGANLLGITLPDLVIRLFGAAELVSVGTLAYSTVKKYLPKSEK